MREVENETGEEKVTEDVRVSSSSLVLVFQGQTATARAHGVLTV